MKKLLVSSVVINVALVGAAAFLYQLIPDLDYVPANMPADVRARTGAGAGYQAGWTSQTGAARGFGPVTEALLPSPADSSGAEMLDLETGRRLTEPDFVECFKRDAKANVAWIRTNGLDISGIVPERGGPICVCYYMAVVPVDPRCWEEAAAADMVGDPALGRIHDPKRRLLTLEPARTDTYLFRTQEGTVGLLRMLGVTDDGRGVRICYKLALAPATVGALAAPARGTLARKVL